jgi:hypothetical protein
LKKKKLKISPGNPPPWRRVSWIFFLFFYHLFVVVKVAPYLVGTLEMVLTALNLMASELIDENILNVLQALCRACGYDSSKTPLENFKARPNDIKFRQVRNTDSQSPGDLELVDLNMLVCEGTMETIVGRITPYTEPRLDATQVHSILMEDMVGKSFPPISKLAYARVSRGTLLASIAPGNNLYDTITEQSLYNVPCSTQVVAEYEKQGTRSRLFFSPAVLPLLNAGVIEDAFYSATITASYPRIKAVKGVMMDQFPDLFKLADWSNDFVDAWVRHLDRNSDGTVPEPRSVGVCINNAEQYLTTMEQNMFLSVRLNPQRTDHDAKYFDICTSRDSNYTLVRDWEMEQAMRVVYNAGLPLDSPVFTDEELLRRYREYLLYQDENCGAVTSIGMDYPNSIVEERQRAVRTGQAISRQMTTSSDPGISSEYTGKGARSQRSHRPMDTSRSIQQRRQLPVTVENNVIATAAAGGGGGGGARQALARAGIF